MNNDNTYFIVFSWMPTRLGLKGIERDVFAIIYGFSQDGVNKYTGSLNYIAEFLQITKRSVINALNSLVDKGFIIKSQALVNGIKNNTYQVDTEVVKKIHSVVKNFPNIDEKISLGGEKISKIGEKISIIDEKISPNNIYTKDIIVDNIRERDKPLTLKKPYGEFQNVLLTDDEYQLLIEQFGNPEQLIKRLDEYKEQSGKQYNSDYMAIRKWVVKAVKEDESSKADIDETYNINDINRKAMLNDNYEI